MTLRASMYSIKLAVSQGSVLGPLLFLLFLNGLPKVIQNAEVVLFADDTDILITGKNIVPLNENMQNVQNQLEN
jgi:hypothetical protein